MREERDGVAELKEGGEVNTTGLWKLKGPDRLVIKDCVYTSMSVCDRMCERAEKLKGGSREREREQERGEA